MKDITTAALSSSTTLDETLAFPGGFPRMMPISHRVGFSSSNKHLSYYFVQYILSWPRFNGFLTKLLVSLVPTSEGAIEAGEAPSRGVPTKKKPKLRAWCIIAHCG